MIDKNLSPKEIFELAVSKHKSKDFEYAEKLYNKVLEKRPDHTQTIFLLATLFVEKKNFINAKRLFEKIIKIQPNNALAYNSLGMISLELNDYLTALQSYKNAIILNPKLSNTRNNLCILLSSMNFTQLSKKDHQELKNLFILLFKRNDVDHTDIFRNAKKVLFYEINYDEILKTKSKVSLLKNQNIHKIISDDLFLLMIQKSIICDADLEKMLIKVRKEILNESINEKNDLSKIFNFILSLAEQCFLNEYVFFQTEDEEKKIRSLLKKIEKSKKINELDISILGCYIPLSQTEKIKKKLIKYKSNNLLFNDLIKIQLKEINKEKEIKKTIGNLKTITDKVSQKVKNQYEKNPYPRWRYTYPNIKTHFTNRFENQIRPNLIKYSKIDKFNSPNVLIAGCGTGRHLFIVNNYSNANILGIDLSLSSLAYAKRKTDEAGIKNIKFLQADILDLKKLKKKFDIIECIGVLHHMKEPTSGLKILIDLLEPHGVLKLGLYSRIARKHVYQVRNFIKKNNFKSNIYDIRQCRKKILSSNNNDEFFRKISFRNDFYSTSTVRDLIFHEQEHSFTILEISQILKKFELEFLGFSDSFIKSKYSKIYSSDKKNVNLENWDKYESSNPNTFIGMYNFWVKKNEDKRNS